MITKLVLIVDDSKSARFVLKRMLEELSLEVDTVESAADAIDYLKHQRPDAIFMDHMMPGMDGFEAVKHIKNNSETCVIPIMMYTSKGGDVYLSQARALGAVGIIPKTISPVDLEESLLKLGLIDSIPIESSPKVDKPVTSKANKRSPKKKVIKKQDVLDTYINDLHRLMDDQTVELHKSMWLGIESVSNEIFNRLNSELEERLDKIQSAPQEGVPENIPVNKTPWPLYIVSVLLLLSIIINVELQYSVNQLENKLAVTNENKIISSDENKTEVLPGNHESREEFIKWAQNKTIEYPYNELALNDSRLSSVEELIGRALEAGYAGSIVLQTHVGRFCLSSDQSGSYKLADGNMSITDCEYIGNYVQPVDEPSTHQSVSFANYLSDMSSLNEKGIVIEVANLTRRSELSKYPEISPQTKVEKWNHAAQLNNRITVNLKPAPINYLATHPGGFDSQIKSDGIAGKY